MSGKVLRFHQMNHLHLGRCPFSTELAVFAINLGGVQENRDLSGCCGCSASRPSNHTELTADGSPPAGTGLRATPSSAATSISPHRRQESASRNADQSDLAQTAPKDRRGRRIHSHRPGPPLPSSNMVTSVRNRQLNREPKDSRGLKITGGYQPPPVNQHETGHDLPSKRPRPAGLAPALPQAPPRKSLAH